MEIERSNPGGLTSAQIINIFQTRGARLSEATFRKYVQAGLLPRSRRVGRKGKHRGSQGLYPVEAVRRVNAIKRMMAQGLTLEDIRASFVVLKNHIEHANRELGVVFDGFERQLEERDFGAGHKKALSSELRALRVQARELLQQVSKFGSAVTARDQGHAVASDA